MLTLGAALAFAGAPARTLGVARAVFQAGPSGGVTVYARSPAPHHGAPARGVPTGDPGDIRIYPVLEDAEYCASGWHLIGLVVGDDPAYYAGHRELLDVLAAVEIRFAVDGESLTVERTAVKRFTDPARLGLDEAFTFHAGVFLPPGTLTPGTHSLTTGVDDPDYGLDEWTVQFTVLDC